jgi:hypothetical protein
MISSTPGGASIYVGGVKMGETGTGVLLTRPGFDTKTVTLKLAGYRDHSFILQKSLNTASIFNLMNIFGWGVDALSGAMMKYDPLNYEIELEKK